MPARPLNLRVGSDKNGKRVACIINEPPQFEGYVLIDDVAQCVWQRCTDDGVDCLMIYPYEKIRYISRSRQTKALTRKGVRYGNMQ